MDAGQSLSTGAEPYGPVAVAFHWGVAVLLVGAVVFGLLAADADDAHVRMLVDLHKSFGLTALVLIAARILWRLTHRPPTLPQTYAPLERHLALSAHLALYVVMFALPVTGYIHDSAWRLAATHPIVLFGLFEVPRIAFIEHLDPVTKEWVHATFSDAHTYLGYALYVLVGLHILGVIKHQFIDKEPELARMLPGRSNGRSSV